VKLQGQGPAGMIKVAHRNPPIRWAIAAVLAVGFVSLCGPGCRITRSVGTSSTHRSRRRNGKVMQFRESHSRRDAWHEKDLRRAKGSARRRTRAQSVKLADGSIVSMRERSELSVSENTRGTTTYLEVARIVVEAAKQINRHLYVGTRKLSSRCRGDGLLSQKWNQRRQGLCDRVEVQVVSQGA
jgi:hypothetical protein